MDKKIKKTPKKRQKQDGLVRVTFFVLPDKRERLVKIADRRGESLSYYIDSVTN